MEDFILDRTLFWQISVQIILIGLNAIFACTEIAVISMNDNKLEKMAVEGNKKAKRLFSLTSQPAKFLSTIQVAITLSGFLGSAFAADNFSEILTDLLVKLGTPIPASISVVVITLILSYFTLVFGELVPKRVAMKNPERIALGISAFISGIAKLFAPVVWLLTVSTNGMLRLLGIDPNAEDEEVTEEEIRMMVDAGSEKGTIDIEEKEIIQNVFEFDDLSVGEIATHRTEVSMLWLEESDEQWETTIHESRHSLYPICDESVDNVVGILNAKDYFRLKDKSRDNVMKNAVRPGYFVPDNTKADVLFKNMKKTRHYFAIVLDEYGGMSGIITITDLIQELVGDFDTDSTVMEDGEEIEKIDSSTWKIKGSAPVDEVIKALGVKIEDDECDTFGGFVMGAFGSVPDDGSTFELDIENMHIKVLEIKERRIVKMIVYVEACENNEEDNEE